MVADFRVIDPYLQKWALQHNLQVYTADRDWAVRSVDIVNARGNKCQIWVEQTTNGITESGF
jgi:hypothetical protein